MKNILQKLKKKFLIILTLIIFVNIFLFLYFNYKTIDILNLKSKISIICYFKDKYNLFSLSINEKDCAKNQKYIIEKNDLVNFSKDEANSFNNFISQGNKVESSYKHNKVESKNWLRSHKNYESNKIFRNAITNNENIKNFNVVWKYDLLDSSNYKFFKKIYNFIFYFYTGINPSYFIKNTYGANPIFYKKNLFLPDLNGNIISIDGTKGEMNWKTKIPKPVARRGLVLDPEDENLYVSSGEGIYILNSNNGDVIDILKVDKSFNEKNINKYGNNVLSGNNVFLTPPIIFNKNIIAANMNSEVLSFSSKSKEINWSISLRKENFRKGAHPWSAMSFDEIREEIYLVTGNPYGGFEGFMMGINREGDNLYANSVICLDINTGKIKWYFQDIMHDLWGLDMAFPPILTSLKIKNKILDVLVIVGKSGNTFVLNRENGKSIHDYLNIRVNDSEIINEQTSKYQKKSIFPNPLINMEIKKSELSNLSKEINTYVSDIFDQGKSGYFQPPALNKKIFYRGLSGGGQWYGGAVNNEGILFVPINNIPWYIFVSLKNLEGEIHEYQDLNGIELQDNFIYHNYQSYFVDQYNNFATKPPWGLLYAIDLKNGSILWKRSYGKTEVKIENNEKIIVEGSPIWGGISILNNIIVAAGSFDSYIYFYDTANGKEIYSIKLDAPGSAPPTIYEIDQKTYIAVVAVGAAQKINTGRYIYGISNKND